MVSMKTKVNVQTANEFDRVQLCVRNSGPGVIFANVIV